MARILKTTVAMIAFILLVIPFSAAAGAKDRAGESLSQRGVDFSLIYYGDAYANVSGGDKRGATYVGNLHLDLKLDMDRLAGWQGASFFFYGLSVHGGHPSHFTGDAQGACDKEGPSQWRLEEAWLQQNLYNDRISALVGIYDLNTEFYSLQSAGLFQNSSFGIGPEFSQSGIEGPSIFPHTSLGMRLAFEPLRGVVFRTALFDGAPLQRPDGHWSVFKNGDGLLMISELDFLSRPVQTENPSDRRSRIGRLSGSPPYRTKIALGGWYYTTTLQDLSETGPDGEFLKHRGSGGVYLLADRNLWQSDRHPGRRLSAFLQLGIGDKRVDRFASYTGGGLVASGLFSENGEDELGLGVARAKNGSHYMDEQRKLGAPADNAETAIELTLLGKLSEWLAIQPSLQYIISPGTDPSKKNAVAFQLVLEVTRGF